MMTIFTVSMVMAIVLIVLIVLIVAADKRIIIVVFVVTSAVLVDLLLRLVFRLLTIYEVEPFGLDDVVNEGAGETRQDLLRPSVRDGFPVLLTVIVIRFHGFI